MAISMDEFNCNFYIFKIDKAPITLSGLWSSTSGISKILYSARKRLYSQLQLPTESFGQPALKIWQGANVDPLQQGFLRLENLVLKYGGIN